MASAACPMPFLPLSPLVAGPALSDDFFSTLVAQGVLKPLPSLSFVPTTRRQVVLAAANNASAVRAKPLAAASSVHIPPRQIIALLDLLERMDNDMVKEVQRVRESIREARQEIAEYKQERSSGDQAVQRRKARERRETKGIDDEFWLQV